MKKSKLTQLLNIQYPIIQAPMAGGITTTELVAAVSNHGGLGFIGAGYMSPEQLRNQIQEIKQLTQKNFGVNLFVPTTYVVLEEEVNFANHALQSIRSSLGLPGTTNIDIPKCENSFASFHEQIKVVMEENISVCSFTFGIPSQEVITRLKENNTILIGTGTTVREAMEIEKAGMDMVVVQGSEAGGHRGNFSSEDQEGLIGLMSLIPQVFDTVNIPVIAAGGIADGRGLLASICLGAQAAQIGTAFLTCVESGAHPVYKQAISNSSGDDTVLTRAFSGKWARGINNRFITEMQEHEWELPEFPVQNALTHAIRKQASSKNNQDYMSLWSGQSPRLAKEQTVEELIRNIMSEAKGINKRMAD